MEEIYVRYDCVKELFRRLEILNLEGLRVFIEYI